MESSDGIALVTGGAGGIGAAVCRRLAESGRRVAVADLDRAATDAVVAELAGVGHIAVAYLPADIFVRYLRARGYDVRFICGSA